MEVITTPLQDCYVIKNVVHSDDRGYFLEGFNEKRFQNETGLELNVKQINFAKSGAGVVRGLHYQLSPYSQAKLVSVISGKVLDVAVDLRRNSKSYLQKFEIVLDKPGTCLYVPRGFAHGYEVLEDSTIFYYAVDNYYEPSKERGVAYNDPSLNISWRSKNLVVSHKDRHHPDINNAEYNFDLE